MVQIKRDPVYEADLADATAQAPALVAAHPDTPLRELINIRRKNPKRNGAFKSKLAIIFDEAFDKRARQLGIQHPERIIG